MIKVKICGVTNTQDALWAANLGADYIGINFYTQSPRKVSTKNAKDIVKQTPSFITMVGVFVNEPLESIAKIVKSVPLKAVQLHGDETPEFCQSVKALGVSVIKAVRLKGSVDISMLEPFRNGVDFFLFDTFVADQPGGTGESFDWTWLQNVSALGKPWFLAGGLTPDNVGAAIKQAQPSMVDVCSGIERLPTRKDFEAMKRFIQTVKAQR